MKAVLAVQRDHGNREVRSNARLKYLVHTLGVDNFEGVDMLLTPSQSVVFRNIRPAQKAGVEACLKMHGIKMIHEIDEITRKSIACPAFPLCGLAITEAERVQPEINARLC